MLTTYLRHGIRWTLEVKTSCDAIDDITVVSVEVPDPQEAFEWLSLGNDQDAIEAEILEQLDEEYADDTACDAAERQYEREHPQ